SAGDENSLSLHSLFYSDAADVGAGAPSRHRMNLAGTPATIAKGSTSLVTTAPAPTMAPFPTVTPGRIVELVPMSAHARTRTGLISRSVWTIGTSPGRPVCADPRTFAPGPQPT